MLSQHSESGTTGPARRRPELEPGRNRILSKLFLISWLHRFIRGLFALLLFSRALSTDEIMTGSISGWVRAPGLKLLSSVEAVTSARHPDQRLRWAQTLAWKGEKDAAEDAVIPRESERLSHSRRRRMFRVALRMVPRRKI